MTIVVEKVGSNSTWSVRDDWWTVMPRTRNSTKLARVIVHMAKRIADRFRPERIILFGSHARGDAGPDSDIDLLVIVDDDTPPEKVTLRAGYESRRSYKPAADVFPIRSATFERKRHIIGSLASEADIEGITVYERR